MKVKDLACTPEFEAITLPDGEREIDGVYVGDLFDEKYSSAVPEAIKPLFCYELLCEIAEGRANPDHFLSFGFECAEIFARYLSQTGDYELALKVKGYILNYSEDNKSSAEFNDYIVSQKQAIEDKMLSYTLENIEKFI